MGKRVMEHQPRWLEDALEKRRQERVTGKCEVCGGPNALTPPWAFRCGGYEHFMFASLDDLGIYICQPCVDATGFKPMDNEPIMDAVYDMLCSYQDREPYIQDLKDRRDLLYRMAYDAVMDQREYLLRATKKKLDELD